MGFSSYYVSLGFITFLFIYLLFVVSLVVFLLYIRLILDSVLILLLSIILDKYVLEGNDVRLVLDWICAKVGGITDHITTIFRNHQNLLDQTRRFLSRLRVQQ